MLNRRLRRLISIRVMWRAEYSTVEAVAVVAVASRDEFLVRIPWDGCEKGALRGELGAWGLLGFEAKCA